MECLKAFERWSRHNELSKYEKVLETWDDKVCENFEPPDETHLNCDTWLAEEEIFRKQSDYIQDLVTRGFNTTQAYMKNFHPFLEQIHDNNNINYSIIMHENLRNPTEVVPLLLKRFNKQIGDFEDQLPEQQDLGLLRIDFTPIKQMLKPNPQDCFDKIAKELPPVIRHRIEESKLWIEDQIHKIDKSTLDPDEFVAQVKALEYIEDTIQDIADNNELYSIMHIICLENKIDISKPDQSSLTNVQTLMADLRSKIMECTENTDNKKEEIKKDINKRIPKLIEEATAF